jgi:hypothetical protein
MPGVIEYAIAASVLAMVLIANVVATRLIVRDKDSESRQKIFQTAFVWLIPIIGAIIVFGIHRPHEKPSGKYRNRPDPGDEYRDPARSASNRTRSEVDLSE